MQLQIRYVHVNVVDVGVSPWPVGCAISHINFGYESADLALGWEFLDHDLTSYKKLRYWVILRASGKYGLLEK